ncbi:hypothetical protein WJX82_009168 [Trebouxia sp. C0006]
MIGMPQGHRRLLLLHAKHWREHDGVLNFTDPQRARAAYLAVPTGATEASAIFIRTALSRSLPCWRGLYTSGLQLLGKVEICLNILSRVSQAAALGVWEEFAQCPQESGVCAYVDLVEPGATWVWSHCCSSSQGQ